MLSSEEFVRLFAAVAGGDRMAFARIYVATRAKLYGVVLRIVRRPEIAAEVLQDAYLHIWNTAGLFGPAGAPPLGWMVAVARGRAIDRVRRTPETPAERDMASPPPAGLPEMQPELTEDLTRLLTCMGHLDREQQRLLLRAYYDGCSREQLAADSGEPASAVKASLLAALAAIRGAA